MPANPPATNQSFGRTFIVAATILAAVALVQLGAVTWAFFNKPAAQLVRAGAAGSKTEEESPAVPPQRIDLTNLPAGEPPAEEPLTVGADPIAESRPLAKPEPI